MPATTLDELKRLTEHLTPLDQVRLIEHLMPRIAQAVTEGQVPAKPDPGRADEAWKEFLHLGEELARHDCPEESTLTNAVLPARR